jgi:hypothetical protein
LRDNARDDVHSFQLSQREMTSIRLHILQKSIEFEFEAPARDGIFQEAVDVRHLLHVELSPQASWIPVGWYSTFCTYSSARKRDDRPKKKMFGSYLDLLIGNLGAFVGIGNLNIVIRSSSKLISLR